jgi:hypothetical protein
MISKLPAKIAIHNTSEGVAMYITESVKSIAKQIGSGADAAHERIFKGDIPRLFTDRLS